MKNTFTLILAVIYCTAFGQSAEEMTRDTTLAREYFLEAEKLELLDTNSFALLKDAIGIYEKYKLKKQLFQVKSQLGYRYLKFGYQEKGFDYANEAMELLRKGEVLPTDPNIKYTYLAFAKYYQKIDYDKCKAYADTVSLLIEKPSDEYFHLSFLLFYPYNYGHENAKLKELIEENKAFLEDDKEKEYQQYWLYYYSGAMVVDGNIGNYESSIIYGEKILFENKKLKLLNKVEIANVMVIMSNTYYFLEKYDEAIEWMNKAIEENNFDESNTDISTYLLNIALYYNKKNDFKKSIEIGERGIEIMYKDTARYKESLTIAHANISVTYRKFGDNKSAKAHLEKANQIGSNFYISYQYSQILFIEEDFEGALKQVQDGIIKISTNFADPNYHANPAPNETYNNEIWAGILLMNKSKYLLSLDQDSSIATLNQAINTAKLAIDVFSRSEKNNIGFERSTFSQNRYIGESKNIISFALYQIYEIKKSEKSLQQLFLAFEQRKATLLLKSIVPNSLPEAIAKQEEKLKKQIQIVDQKIRTVSPDSVDFYQNKLFELNQEVKGFISKLSEEGYKQKDYIYDINYASIPDIQRQLDISTAFISYSNDISNIFITTIKKGTVDIVKIKKDSLYQDKFAMFQKLIKNPLLTQKKKRDQFIESSYYLYENLIQPIAHHLESIDKLMIVPGNELFYLPFETLLASNESKSFEELDFLIKKYDINYHYSATTYKRLQAKKTIQNQSLLAFAPVFTGKPAMGEALRSMNFELDSLFSGVRDNHYTPLPNTKNEVNAINKILGNKSDSQVLLNEQATKANFIAKLNTQQHQFIHFATHGFINSEDSKFSGLACYKTSEAEDGLLFANEVQQLDINADLVVLSSCESGIGQLFSGEGLIALNRSFVYAGAKNVLFSLWKINDQYSSDLMIDFYKEIKTGKSYTAALRKAKLKMLSNPSTATPRYWAPFVLMGE